MSHQIVRSGRRDLTVSHFDGSTISETPTHRQRRRREEHEVAFGHFLQLVHSLSEVVSPLKAVAGGVVFVMGHRQKVRNNRKNIAILLKSMIMTVRMAQEGVLRILTVSQLLASLAPNDVQKKRPTYADQDANELCTRLMYFQYHLMQRHSAAVDAVGQRSCSKHGISQIPDQVGRIALQPMGILHTGTHLPFEMDILERLEPRRSRSGSNRIAGVLDSSEPLRRLFNNLADLYKDRLLRLCGHRKHLGHYRMPEVIALEIQECHEELRGHVMSYQTELLEIQVAYQRIMLHFQQRNHEEVIARLKRLEHKVHIKSESTDRARWWDSLANAVFD